MNACLVTVANERQHYFDLFQESAKRHGISPIILGWGQPYPGDYVKLILVRQFLQSDASAYSHIVFADAFDVLLAAGLDEIISRFEQFHEPCIFAAERICFPKDLRSLYEQHPAYSFCRECGQLRGPSLWCYLNSGFWVATLEGARAVYSAIREAPTKTDQRIFGSLFAAGMLPAVLDYQCKIVQCVCISEDDLTYENGRIKNKVTGEYPCVFHGNGRTKMREVLNWLAL